MKTAVPILRGLMALGPLKRASQHMLTQWFRGPSKEKREESKSFVWASARNESGQEAQVWLELPGGYPLTAMASVRSVEKILAGAPHGALTPALAFGEDFVLEIPGAKRFDTLEG